MLAKRFPVLTLLLVALTLPARADLSADLDRAARQLDLLESKARLIRSQYVDYRDVKSESRRFDKRLNDGQALMLLKDYVRASIIFYDLVQNASNKDSAAFADVLFNLAESLFFNKNYIDARNYYHQVIGHRYGRPYRRLSLVRLMQIALNTNEYDKVDEVHAHLVREGGSSPEAEYLWGKTLLRRNRLEQAAQAFSSVAAGQPKFFQARYLLGVVLIRQGRLEDALALYQSLASAAAENVTEREVRELASLARGRILHDLGRAVEALDAYQSIEHTSKYFDQALLEVAWTYINRGEQAKTEEARRADFTEALRTLEILEVSTPNSRLVPRTQLLKGHLLEKMGRFQDAAAIFSKVARDYAGVKKQLDEIFTAHDDPVRYFNEVAGRQMDQFDLAAYVPPVAVRWMSAGDEMAAALGVMKNLQTGRRFIKEARNLLKKLDGLLAGADRVNLFPVLKEAIKRTMEVENGRIILERNISAIEERIINEHLSANQRRQLEQARRERLRLESLVNKLPVTKKAFDEREQKIRGRIEQLEIAVYESGVALKGIRAQLRAMEEWLGRNRAKLVGREEAVQAFLAEIRGGYRSADALQAELDQLKQMLATEKARAGMDRETLGEEEQLKKRYTAALERERQLAEQIHARLGPEGTAQVTRINDLRLRSARLGRGVKVLREKLEERIGKKAEEMKASAALEARRLDQFEEALNKLSRESENLAGQVAYQALRDVRDQFYRLVLDAEVGLLDVAWSRKHDKTKRITELGKKLGDERKRLYEEFKSVLQEVN
ncbi:MAG: hypothetical protein DRI34_04780 [Deltaproteobacteria bacterium]|nr:MAG: hypothetical protein DRI34_04780 [Deltaproteobacteria bacterium]